MSKEEAKERKKDSMKGWFYASQRTDLLVISISGAAIYLILETLKYISEKQIGSCLLLLKISGVFFLIAIIVNFFSQLSSKKTNYYDVLMCDEIINPTQSLSDSSNPKVIEYDELSEKYSDKTRKRSVISMVSALIGLSSIVSYFLLTF